VRIWEGTRVDSGGYRARLQSERIWEERCGGWQQRHDTRERRKRMMP
jgi:hypothetical protein